MSFFWGDVILVDVNNGFKYKIGKIFFFVYSIEVNEKVIDYSGRFVGFFYLSDVG